MEIINHSPRFYNPDGMQKCEGIVIHSMAEFIQVDDEVYRAHVWLDVQPDVIGQPNQKASAHEFVQPDGSVVQCGDIGDTMYHAGTSGWKGWNLLNRNFYGIEVLVAGTYNYWTYLKAIGIDPQNKVPMHDPPNSPYTDAQYRTVAERVNRVLKATQADRSNVMGHEVVSPGRKFDPGPLFDWAELYRYMDRPKKSGASYAL